MLCDYTIIDDFVPCFHPRTCYVNNCCLLQRASRVLSYFTAGLLVSALSIFGAQSNVERADLSWGYWLTVAAGVVLLANGLTLGILVGREGCTMDKILPPARHNKVKAEKDVRLQNV